MRLLEQITISQQVDGEPLSSIPLGFAGRLSFLDRLPLHRVLDLFLSLYIGRLTSHLLRSILSFCERCDGCVVFVWSCRSNSLSNCGDKRGDAESR